jgi:hypothetical protein
MTGRQISQAPTLLYDILKLNLEKCGKVVINTCNKYSYDFISNSWAYFLNVPSRTLNKKESSQLQKRIRN